MRVAIPYGRVRSLQRPERIPFRTPTGPWRGEYSCLWVLTLLLVVIAVQGIAGCTATRFGSDAPPPTMVNVAPATYPSCSSDHRGRYTTIEVPYITDIGHAPSAFFSLLHEAIMAEGRQRNIYQVVPSSNEHAEVVRLTMSVDSWTPDLTRGGQNGILSMKLFLIDKTHQCQVSQTTGHGDVRHDAETGFHPEDIRGIAESAGWFVGITLMHDP